MTEDGVVEMTKIFSGLLLFPLLVGCSGLCDRETDFVGMTRAEVAAFLERAPRTRKGMIPVAFCLSEKGQLVAHRFDDAKWLLVPPAVESEEWQVFYHLDKDGRWHSYILTFADGKVVRQEERRQPHWVMAGE